ncbi:MAG: hypothetical protein AAGG44_01045 [Planctomycetota bacterium]
MDWIDPKYASKSQSKKSPGSKASTTRSKGQKKTKRGSSKTLATQVQAALAQPHEVWTAAYDHALGQLTWPKGCTAEGSFLWSSVSLAQAEVLVRCGVSGKRLSSIVSSKEQESEQLAEIVGLMEHPLESQAFGWLDSADLDPKAALATVALAWHLPDHAKRSGNEWLSQWLQATVERFATLNEEPEAGIFPKLAFQCELPLLVALATASSNSILQSEASKAMDFLAEHLESIEVNIEGWLLGGAKFLRPALGSILRCRVLANSLGLRKWYPPQQKALAELLCDAARWSRPDGTQIMAANRKAPKARSYWSALAGQTRRPKSMQAVMTLNGIGDGKRSEVVESVSVAKLPPLTQYSEYAAAHCGQTDWRKKGSKFAVDFSNSQCTLEALGPKGTPLIAGPIQSSVEIDGQAQMQLNEWREICWFSDDDVDYLEIESQFGDKAKIQRQIILLRDERLLMLGDTLMVEEPSHIKLTCDYPLAPGTRFCEQSDVTEGHLECGNVKSLVLPLFLPEWRRELSITGDKSQLSGSPQSLTAIHETRATRLYMPTIISLCPALSKQPYTWRHLTVADELRIVARDEAQAFRVQFGEEQFFFYRNLGRPARRTALGVHTVDDFYAARFDVDEGDCYTIVQVEPMASSASNKTIASPAI